MGYALHNGVPASVSSFEAASTDLLFMYERVRTTPAPHRATVHTHTDTATRRRERGVVVRHVVVATLSHREREREREGGRQAWSCSLRVLLGFHELDDDREMRREQAHSPGTDNGVRHCKSNLPSVFPPCTENTLSANHSRPLSTHGFPSVQSFPQKFRDLAIHFHVKIFRIVIRFVSPTTCYRYPRDLSF